MEELTLDSLPDLPQIAVLKRITTRLWADSEVIALWLGGSIARGKADAHSDIDLRVAVRPETLADWQEPERTALSALIGETVVGVHALRWEGTVLHQALLADGVIIDLLVQSVSQDPPPDVTLVLGCRDAAFGALLASAALPEVEEMKPADPEAIREAITLFWIGSHKHVRMLSRHLDLLILQGLALELPVLLRLWYAEATGRDQGSQRPTIHTLTPMMRAITEATGPHSLEVLGSARTNRAEIVRAIEANRNEVTAVGRRLAATFGFEYPDALEQTARQNLTQYLKDGILQEQIAYYRARAGEYDQWFLREGRYDRGPEANARWFTEAASVEAALKAFAPSGRVLELACGTGLWTRHLVRADSVTALDASPEVLEINRARVSDPKVRYAEVDLLNWKPDGVYDTIFFSFWLSHVPPERFDDFWNLVQSCLAPGGRVFLLDSLYDATSTAADHTLEEADAETQTRRLNDGREFRIVKVFYPPEELARKLTGLGWRFDMQSTPNYFLYGSGERQQDEA